MGRPVEHITDLGLVNYVQHPTNSNYIVFRFADEERAKTFEAALLRDKIWFEKSEQEGRTRMFYLFGVHRQDYPKVQQLNFIVEAQHRSFIIKNGLIRWILLLFTTSVIILAFVGYCTANKNRITVTTTEKNIYIIKETPFSNVQLGNNTL